MTSSMSSLPSLPCPACGAPGTPGASICDNSGLVYASHDAQAGPMVPTSPAPPPTALALAPVARCPHCGETIPLGRRGCPACGRGLARSPGLSSGLMIGHRRYRVIQPLGKGGMGTLYLAHDTQNQRRVALKVLAQPDAEIRQLLLQEGQILGQLHHPAIPRLLDSFDDQGMVGLAIEYTPGASLDAQLSYTDPVTGAL